MVQCGSSKVPISMVRREVRPPVQSLTTCQPDLLASAVGSHIAWCNSQPAVFCVVGLQGHLVCGVDDTLDRQLLLHGAALPTCTLPLHILHRSPPQPLTACIKQAAQACLALCCWCRFWQCYRGVQPTVCPLFPTPHPRLLQVALSSTVAHDNMVQLLVSCAAC